MSVVMRAQSRAANAQAKLLLPEANFLRVDPPVPDGLFGLDDVSMTGGLMATAADESRGLLASLRAQFLQHRAAPYEPTYD